MKGDRLKRVVVALLAGMLTFLLLTDWITRKRPITKTSARFIDHHDLSETNVA